METRRRVAISVMIAWVLMGSCGDAQSLYWVESTFSSPSLKKSAVDGSNVQTLNLDSASLPQGIAYDARRDSVYWVELAFAGARINAASPSPAARRTVLGGASVLRDIAVDTAARTMYWTATNLATGSMILRANLNGTSPDTLIKWNPGGAEAPRGIALDVAAGKMYWADFDLGRIRGANLNGTTLEDILSSLNGPVGLRLDVAGGKMYWTEANARTIKRANLNGSGIEMLVTTTGTPNYIALDIVGGKMYWTEIGIPKIRKADLNGQNAQDIPVSVNDPAGIMVVRTALNDVSFNPSVIPHEYALLQNYPNPFNPSTTIQYDLPFAGNVSLRVYDYLGREITVLAEGHADAGSYKATWNAGRVASGVYFYKLRSESYTQVRRMLLVK
ncbi:MAG: Peptidase and subtilisin, kexin, sedolisin [Bacteroidetes bacterium]|nr:Peptidase and subtilisin, kexin, sedolisin [Bacteroidota bacterium]